MKHSVCTTIIDLAALINGLLHRANTINFCLANDDSRQIADLTHTKLLIWVVITVSKFPVEIDVVRFFFLFSIFCGPWCRTWTRKPHRKYNANGAARTTPLWIRSTTALHYMGPTSWSEVVDQLWTIRIHGCPFSTPLLMQPYPEVHNLSWFFDLA